MVRSPRVTYDPGRLPTSRVGDGVSVRGRVAVATYLRAHLYGASVGRSILERCIAAVESDDRARLVPLRAEFDAEIATARRLLADMSPWGTPGRRVVRAFAMLALAGLPAGPIVREPLTRLGLLETLRTLVVSKRSMWDLLARSWVADGADDRRGGGVGGGGYDDDNDTVRPGGIRARCLDLADQARAQEDLLEELRRKYGLAVFG